MTEFWQKFVDEERDFSKYDETLYLSLGIHVIYSYILTAKNEITEIMFRPVDVWLRHFVRPFHNSYGYNIYREFWRVWVPLLLAPRYRI